MNDPIYLAAAKVLASLLPDLISWIASSLRGGSDPEAEIRLLMSSAEEAARLREREKFGE